jgi:hypothetical protein
MSDKPHYTVTDHNGGPLCLDLKGRERFPQTASQRPGADATRMPMRGISDTGPELQRRAVQLRKEQPDLSEEKGFHRSTSPKKLNRDLEPKLSSKSIRVQGHVGRGRLEGDLAGESWTLRIHGAPEFEVEAFPDTIPNLRDPVAVWPHFVVLAAKQVYIPLSFMGNVDLSLQGRRDVGRLASIDELVETGTDEEFDYTGHGILLKATGNARFCRTGAFRFRNASEKVYRLLQAGDKRKFWLD